MWVHVFSQPFPISLPLCSYRPLSLLSELYCLCCWNVRCAGPPVVLWWMRIGSVMGQAVGHCPSWHTITEQAYILKGKKESTWKFEHSRVSFCDLWQLCASQLRHAKIPSVCFVCWRLLPLCPHCVLERYQLWNVLECESAQVQSSSHPSRPRRTLTLCSLNHSRSSSVPRNQRRATCWASGSRQWDAHTPCPMTATCFPHRRPPAMWLQHSFKHRHRNHSVYWAPIGPSQVMCSLCRMKK